MVLADQQGPENAAYLPTKLDLPDLEIPLTVYLQAQTPQFTEPCPTGQHWALQTTSILLDSQARPQKPSLPQLQRCLQKED